MSINRDLSRFITAVAKRKGSARHLTMQKYKIGEQFGSGVIVSPGGGMIRNSKPTNRLRATAAYLQTG